jgi:hypothetical protein
VSITSLTIIAAEGKISGAKSFHHSQDIPGDHMAGTSEKDTGSASHDKKELSVVVVAPRSPDPKPFSWSKTMKVGEAARDAATAFGYTGGNPGLQTSDDPARALDNNKPLVAEGVKDGDQLELIDTGGGV